MLRYFWSDEKRQFEYVSHLKHRPILYVFLEQFCLIRDFTNPDRIRPVKSGLYDIDIVGSPDGVKVQRHERMYSDV